MSTEQHETAKTVLRFLAAFPAAMNLLDSPSISSLQHVKLRVPDGPDIRLDKCPCARGLETLPVDAAGQPIIPELGGGQYVSSGLHFYGDLIRDVMGVEAEA